MCIRDRFTHAATEAGGGVRELRRGGEAEVHEVRGCLLGSGARRGGTARARSLVGRLGGGRLWVWWRLRGRARWVAGRWERVALRRALAISATAQREHVLAGVRCGELAAAQGGVQGTAGGAGGDGVGAGAEQNACAVARGSS